MNGIICTQKYGFAAARVAYGRNVAWEAGIDQLIVLYSAVDYESNGIGDDQQLVCSRIVGCDDVQD